MKVYRELELRGESSILAQVVKLIENNLNKDWVRDLDQENKISSASPNEIYCFTCTDNEDREAASLWLDYRDGETLYVSNIVPQKIRQLNYDQYNLILEEFYNEFAKPATERFGVEHNLTSNITQIEDWISNVTAAKLKHFSSLANKSTGSSHALDQQRWFDFIVSAHKETAPLNTNILKRWLVEDENWPEDEAFELSIEYEFARSLLNFYDENR